MTANVIAARGGKGVHRPIQDAIFGLQKDLAVLRWMRTRKLALLDTSNNEGTTSVCPTKRPRTRDSPSTPPVKGGQLSIDTLFHVFEDLVDEVVELKRTIAKTYRGVGCIANSQEKKRSNVIPAKFIKNGGK